MSRWSDQFDNHAIHATVQQLRDWLDVEVEKIDAEQEDERLRFKKAMQLVKAALDGQDAELFPENLLTNLNSQLRQALVKQLNMKYAPEIRFVEDKFLEQNRRIEAIIDNLDRSEDEQPA